MFEAKKLLEEFSVENNAYIYPDWEGVGYRIDEIFSSKEEVATAWMEVSRAWTASIRQTLGANYGHYETSNFLIVCDVKIKDNESVGKVCESSLTSILEYFGGKIDDAGYGKHVVLIFNKLDDYYKYCSDFCSDGSQPVSSGMCITRGYTHIAIPYTGSFFQMKEIMTHELTHALLVNFEVPNWLNEALAMRLEGDTDSWHNDGFAREQKDDFNRFLEYWNPETIQKFWSGEIWAELDEAEHGYNLSKALWRVIERELQITQSEVYNLVRTVEYKDAGAKAFQELLGCSLGDLVSSFLGEGKWEPDQKYLDQQQFQYLKSQEFLDEIKHFESIEMEKIPAMSVQELKPSTVLSSLFQKLEVNTIGEFIKSSAKEIYLYRDIVNECRLEIESKLWCLELSMLYEEQLHEVCSLLSNLQGARIKGGSLNGEECVMYLETEHIGGLIHPDYKEFRIEFSEFQDYGFECAESSEVISATEVFELGLDIDSVEVCTGTLLVSCENDEISGDLRISMVERSGL